MHRKNPKTTALWFLLITCITFLSSCVRQYDEKLLVYFVRGGDIYSITESGEDETLLLSGGTYNYPCCSADGKYLLCRSGAISAIFDLKSLNQIRTFPTASPYTHAWSPDGKKISATDGPGTTQVYDARTGSFLWTSAGGGKDSHYFTNDSLYITETSGNTLYEFTPAVDTIPEMTRVLPGAYENLTLSPDGKRIACDDTATIFILNEDTLTIENSFPGEEPSWSPDNESLVYVNGGNLYIFNTRNGDSRQISFSGSDSYPCFQYKPR